MKTNENSKKPLKRLILNDKYKVFIWLIHQKSCITLKILHEQQTGVKPEEEE